MTKDDTATPIKKRKNKSLNEILDSLAEEQRKNYLEEEDIINKILEKKPELRNTTAKFLKN